jgi:type II secretory pathway pseudopilin PulG
MKSQKGQSLFEVVLALGVITAITVGIVSLTVNAMRNAAFSKNKTLAGRYAQEATEWLRSERDYDFDAFVNHVPGISSVTYCLPSLPANHIWPASGACSSSNYISGTTLLRKVVLTKTTPSGKTIIEADVVVYWNDAQGYHEVRSATLFSDWKQR